MRSKTDPKPRRWSILTSGDWLYLIGWVGVAGYGDAQTYGPGVDPPRWGPLLSRWDEDRGGSRPPADGGWRRNDGLALCLRKLVSGWREMVRHRTPRKGSIA
jgi:hypothetical protein